MSCSFILKCNLLFFPEVTSANSSYTLCVFPTEFPPAHHYVCPRWLPIPINEVAQPTCTIKKKSLATIWLIRTILEDVTNRHIRTQPISTSWDTAACTTLWCNDPYLHCREICFLGPWDFWCSTLNGHKVKEKSKQTIFLYISSMVCICIFCCLGFHVRELAFTLGKFLKSGFVLT